jgi:hypothetical protein
MEEQPTDTLSSNEDLWDTQFLIKELAVQDNTLVSCHYMNPRRLLPGYQNLRRYHLLTLKLAGCSVYPLTNSIVQALHRTNAVS